MEDSNTINNAFAELYDIICHMENDLINKIPRQFIGIVKENRNPNYIVNIDYSRNINEQSILHETKILLSLIYRDFLVDRQKSSEMKHMDQLAIEEKYNPENLFKKKTENVEKKENMQIIIKTEDAWYIKIIKAIADIFHKSK